MKKIGKILLLMTLIMLFAGIVSANELSDNSTGIESDMEVVQDIQAVSDKDAGEIQSDVVKQNDKKIVKSDKSTVKMSGYTYDVDNTDALYDAIHSKDYSDVIINIVSDFTLTNSKQLTNTTVKTFTINGNGHTINGDKQYQFLWITCPCTLSISNLTVLNSYSAVHGGAIDIYGPNATINNCNFINCSSNYGGAIDNDNKGVLILNNCILSGNYAFGSKDLEKGGGAIFNEDSTLIIDNCTITDNRAEFPGGAIYNRGTMKINNSVISGNVAYNEAGAIFNVNANTRATITIANTVISDNEAKKLGGAISNEYCRDFVLTNCTFKNNRANTSAGVMYNAYTGAMTIDNCSFVSNTAATSGGVIINQYTLSINNSIFEDNTAGNSGGAINNLNNDWFKGFITINNTKFNNNVANGIGESMGGGAIFNNGGRVVIYDSTLNNNEASSYGGAILNSGILNITSTALQSNKAVFGGAVFTNGSTFNLFDSVLKNNTATNKMSLMPSGSAIYGKSNGNIENNYFACNNANYFGTAIFAPGATVKSNVNSESTAYPGTIVSMGDNVQIKYNTFSEEPFATTINITADTTSPQVNENINLKFQLYDEFNLGVSNQFITIKITDKTNYERTYRYLTNDDGIININYSPTFAGTLKIEASHAKTEYYKASSASMNLNVHWPTQIIMNNVTSIAGKEFTVTGYLMDASGNRIKNENVYMNIGGPTYLLTTDDKGQFSTALTYVKSGKYDIVALFNGDTFYSSSNITRTLTVLSQSKIAIDILNNTESNVEIEITATDTMANALVNHDVIITLPNGETTTRQTGSDGKITVTDTTATAGKRTVIAKIDSTDELMGTRQTRQVTVEPDYQKIIDELTDIISQQNDTINDLNNTVKQQNKTINDLTDENYNLKAQINNLTQELEDANTKIQALNDTVNTLTKKLDDAERTIVELNEIIDNLTGQLDEANTKIASLNDTVNTLTKKLDDAERTIVELNEIIDNLTGQLDEANSKIEALTAENNDLKNKLEDANSKIQALNDTVNTLTKKLDDAERTIAELNKVIDNLTGQLEEANSIINNLTKELNDAYSQIEALNESNKKLNSQLEEVNRKLEEAYKKIDSLEKIIQDLNDKLNEANNIISQLNDYINSLLNKTKLNTTITVNPVKSSVGSVVTVSAAIRDKDNRNVTGGKVVFKVNGITLKDEYNNVIYAPVNNGYASISYKVQDVWAKDTSYIQAVYSGSENYTSARTNSSDALEIEKGSATLTLEKSSITAKSGQNITFRAKVLDANGDRINAGKVVFKLNGKSISDDDGNVLYAKVTDGEAVLEYTIPQKYSAKTYVLTAVFGGGSYQRAETNATLVLEKKGVTINTDSITSKNSRATIKATITDETGELLVTSTKLAFKVNGKTILNGVNSTNGIIDVTFSTPLRPGMYELLIISGENGIYKTGKMTTILKIE